MGTTRATAAERWAADLATWAIPDGILARAPESPHGFGVGRFSRIADEALRADRVSARVAREALPEGGSVLDVGCGGGAGSLPLAPPAARLIGVDETAGMLDAFTERAAERAADVEAITGRWPDAAGQAPVADVVVCHNVLYNVPDIAPFVRALTDHARHRVVVEIGETHPWSWLNPHWWHLHGVERPTRPTAADAAEVIREQGCDVAVQRWKRTVRTDRDPDEQVAEVRWRLCLGAERDAEIRELLERYPRPETRDTVTLWWSPPG